jgi:Protein of unknown function (DUF2778)
MSYAIDNFGDISSFVVLVPPPPRRKFRFVALGVTAFGCGMLATGLAAATMAGTWLALKSFGSAPDFRANVLAATKPVALAEPHFAAADVPVDVKPSPITEPSTLSPLPAAAGSVAPPPLAAAPEITPAPAVASSMALLPPDTATPRIARLPLVAPSFSSGPLGAATPSSLPPPTSKVASLPPNGLTPDAVPLPPRRPAGLTESLPAPPAEAARAPVVELSPPTVERDHDAARAAPGETTAQPTLASAPSAAAPAQLDNRSILQRIFDAFSQAASSARGGTAVYDIAAHAVYMPNGERLEAHSGLGSNLDDPRSFSQKNQGVIPPQTYALQPREQLFHGVAALRLNPVGDGDMYGRVGMLAHSYMLGPRGDSNGCVSFKDYDKFLAAYQRGEVSRLIVVTHGGAGSSSVASVVRD